jgi:hypothetical protein
MQQASTLALEHIPRAQRRRRRRRIKPKIASYGSLPAQGEREINPSLNGFELVVLI